MLNIKALQFRYIPQKKRIAYAFAFSNTLLLAKVILAAGFDSIMKRITEINIIIALTSVILYIYSIKGQTIKKKVFIKSLLLLMVILIAWIVTAIIFPERFFLNTVISDLKEFLIYCLPVIVFIAFIEDFQDVMLAFYKYKNLLIFLTLLSSIGLFTSNSIHVKENYSMGFGHAVLWPTILSFSRWFNANKIKDLIFGIFGFICIFLFGSRYPLLCTFTFIIIKLLQERKSKRVKLIFFLSIPIIIIIILWGKDIAIWLYNFLYNSFGIKNRSLRLITNDLATYSSGRNIIHETLIEAINKSPIYGYGIGGASFLLSDEFAHSFILDVFAMAGYVFGGIILAISSIKIIRLYKYTNSKLIKEFITICLSIWLPILTFQTSFWSCRYYWYLIALSIFMKYNNRRSKYDYKKNKKSFKKSDTFISTYV